MFGLGALFCLGLALLFADALQRDRATRLATTNETSLFMGRSADSLLDFETIGAVDSQTYPALARRFQPSDGAVPGFGTRYFENGALWLRFTTPELPHGKQDWIIRLDDARARTARLVILKGDTFNERRWSYDDADHRSGFGARVPVFPVDRAEIEGATILLGYTSTGALRGQAYVETAAATNALETRETVVSCLISGGLLALALYLLVIGFLLREPNLYFAGGLSLFLGLFIFGGSGFVHAVIFPGSPLAGDHIVYGTQPVVMSFWLMFLTSYLDVGRKMRWLASALFIFAALLPFQGLLVLIQARIPDQLTLNMTNTTPVTAGLIAGFATLLLFAFRGDRRAHIFLLCFLPLGVMSILRLVLHVTESVDPFWLGIGNTFFDVPVTMGLLAVMVVLDIQNRETRLRTEAVRNEQRFREYAEIASDSYFELSSDGTVLSSAGRLTRELGLVEGSRLQTIITDHSGPDSQVEIERLTLALRDKEALRDVEINMHLAGDRMGWLSFSMVPALAGMAEPAGLRGTIADVTDRVDRRQRETRQNTLSALGQLAGGVAHEVNNLLHPMINLAQRVRDKHISDDEARKLLDLVVSSGKHASEIVASVLNSFNPARAQGKPQLFQDALGDAVQTVRATLPASVDMRSVITATSSVKVAGGEVLQVVSNLLSNAIRAMDGVGIVTITLTSNESGGTVLTFEDNGPGMPEQMRQRAIEPFVSGRAEGTGLGLSLVANIVHGWHGDLAIQSSPGAGTRIVITLEPDIRPS